MRGSAYVMNSATPSISQLMSRLSQSAINNLLGGQTREQPQPLPSASTRPAANVSPEDQYPQLSQELGDRLTEYELVEDLIERGILAENEDGTLYIQL